jgi:hypothetical protein
MSLLDDHQVQDRAEVWTLTDDPEDEAPLWGAEDAGARDRTFRR